jgi:hypothetical protein
MLPTSNFAFLSVHDAQLVQLGVLAERYFQHDPTTAIFKLRQFAELLSKTIAAHHALYVGERETFEDRQFGGHWVSASKNASRSVAAMFGACGGQNRRVLQTLLRTNGVSS